MKDKIRKLLAKLENTNFDSVEGYNVEDVPGYENHKIGLSVEGAPIFFIKINGDYLVNQVDYNLELISIRFNCKCVLKLNSIHQFDDTYTIIELNSKNEIISEYFSNIILLLITRIGNNPSMSSFKDEIGIILELFVKLNSPSKRTIQGLWAELFLIKESSDPQYLINSWHNNTNDTFDFNDGIDKIEVKSTLSSNREHIISNGQLYPSSNSSLVFCSFLMQESGMGTTIFDLINDIETQLNEDHRCIDKLHSIVFATLGSSIEKSSELYFDFNYAKDNFKIFNYQEIPKIKLEDIPSQITDLKFKCDFSGIPDLNVNHSQSMLLSAIL